MIRDLVLRVGPGMMMGSKVTSCNRTTNRGAVGYVGSYTQTKERTSNSDQQAVHK